MLAPVSERSIQILIVAASVLSVAMTAAVLFM